MFYSCPFPFTLFYSLPFLFTMFYSPQLMFTMFYSVMLTSVSFHTVLLSCVSFYTVLTSPHLTNPLRAQWPIRPKCISSCSLCQLLYVWSRSNSSTPVRVFHFQQLITKLSFVDHPFFYLRAPRSTPSHICCSCPFVGYVLPFSIFLT